MNIIDNVQDNAKIKVKVYPYLINASIEDNMNLDFIEPNATTIISLSNKQMILNSNNFESFMPHSKKEYFEGVISDIELEKLGSYENTPINGNNWMTFDNLELISNDFTYNLKDTLKNKTHDLLFVFTLNKPFDDNDKKQKVFFTTLEINNNALDDREKRFEKLISDKKQEQLFTLTSHFQVQSSYENCRIKFKVSKSLKSLQNDNEANDIEMSIKTSPYALIDNIKVDNIDENEKRDEFDISIDTNTDTSFLPFKWTPVNINNGNITIYTPWWDYNFALPYLDAQAYLQPDIEFDYCFKQFKGPGTADVQTQDFIHVIHNIILVAHLFKTQFRDIPLLKPNKNNPAAQTQIDPEQTLGESYSYHTQPLHIVNITNQSPIQVAKMMYDQFIGHYGSSIDDDNLKTYNAIIASLSQYLFAMNAVSQGLTSFNEIVLPWTLETISPLTLARNGNNWTLNTNQMYWRFKSKYFKTINNDVNPIQPKFGIYRQITTDNATLLAPLSDQVAQEKMITEPRLMSDTNNQNNNNFTKYISYIPNNNVSWKKYMLGQKGDIYITEQTITFDLPPMSSTQYDAHFLHLDKDIVDYVKNDLGYGPNVNVEIIYRGDKSQGFGFLKTMNHISPHLEPDPSWTSVNDAQLLLIEKLNDCDLWKGLNKNSTTFNVPLGDNLITLGDVRTNRFVIVGRPGFPGYYSYLEYDFDIKIIRDSYKNVKVHITNITPFPQGVDYKRPVLYNKNQWKDAIANITKTPDVNPKSTFRLTGDDIKKQTINSFVMHSLFNDVLELEFVFKDASQQDVKFNVDIKPMSNKNETITKSKIIFK